MENKLAELQEQCENHVPHGHTQESWAKHKADCTEWQNRISGDYIDQGRVYTLGLSEAIVDAIEDAVAIDRKERKEKAENALREIVHAMKQLREEQFPPWVLLLLKNTAGTIDEIIAAAGVELT